MQDRIAHTRCIHFGLFLVAVLLTAPSAFGQVVQLRPNIEALPANEIALRATSAGKELVFSASTWNSGQGPLELIAGETGPAGQNVYQRVSLSNGSNYDNLAGTFEWHETHAHFHFGDYALYTLQPENAPGGSKRTSRKTTFCVMDNVKVNVRLPEAPKQAAYGGCGATVQGMSVGWGDKYAYYLEGQSIDVTGNPDGTYLLIIEADPEGRILEIDDTDNTSCVRLNITGFTVNVLGNCTPSPGQLTVAGISPNTMLAGSVVNVTITGTGFFNGVKVSFENGAGSRPTATNVIVVSPNTLTANVTVKSGGPGRDKVWDLRVDSAVLPDAFTIGP